MSLFFYSAIDTSNTQTYELIDSFRHSYIDFNITCHRPLNSLAHILTLTLDLSDTAMGYFLLVLHVTPDSLGLDNWGTWHRCLRWDLIVEWRNLVTGRKLHWLQVGLEPSTCRQHSHCCKRAKPLRHLATQVDIGLHSGIDISVVTGAGFGVTTAIDPGDCNGLLCIVSGFDAYSGSYADIDTDVQH